MKRLLTTRFACVCLKNSRMISTTLLKLSLIVLPAMATLASPSSLKAVKRFTSEDGVDFVIDEKTKVISAALVVVGDVDIQHLYYTPTIIVSDKATISPASGVKEDFVNPVTYTVTAEDGTKQLYTVNVQQFDFTGRNSNARFGATTNQIPQKLPWTYLVSSETAMISGTWDFAYSGALEVRQVETDQVLTLLEQTPTTQIVTVKVNDDEQAPTQSHGVFGWSLTLNANKTYTSKDEQGDSGSGTWRIVDLGKSALNRYELELDGVTVIAGGPSASGITTWYITGINQSALHLTQDPIITSKSTTTFDLTLTARRQVAYQFSASKPGAGGLTLSWTWGTAPFQVQFKDTLSGVWSNVATLNHRTYTASPQGAAGFFRIVATGGN